MKRKRCVGRCDFKPTDEGEETCTRCGDVFPCRLPNDEAQCGHTDCEEARGKLPICPVCKKLVLPEDRFNASDTRRDRWVAVHREICFDTYARSQVVTAPPWNGQVGASVRVDPSLDAFYRDTYGDAIDDLVVEGIVNKAQVLVKGIGMVPAQHLRMKETDDG